MTTTRIATSTNPRTRRDVRAIVLPDTGTSHPKIIYTVVDNNRRSTRGNGSRRGPDGSPPLRIRLRAWIMVGGCARFRSLSVGHWVHDIPTCAGGT